MTAPAQAPSIYLINQSTLVTDAQVAAMADACDHQIAQHIASAWRLLPSPVRAVPRGQVPRGGWNLVVLDTLDEAGALGWHTDDGQGIHGVVGAKASMDAGYKVLTGPYAVSATCSHEAAELFCNPNANAWRDTGRGSSVIQEVCDPVEVDWYLIDGVAVSNFVLPDYFDPTPASTKFDYMGTLHRPFSIAKGGYQVVESQGRSSQRFGDEVPAWRRTMKSDPNGRAGSIALRRAS